MNLRPGLRVLYSLLLIAAPALARAPRQMEFLDRGLVAVRMAPGRVLVSWRLLGTDPPDLGFNLYRSDDGSFPVKLTTSPLTDTTCFADALPVTAEASSYFVRPVHLGSNEDSGASSAFVVNASARDYLPIPIQPPEGYHPGDVAAGDLDGDGVYEFVVHQVGRGRDNSQSGLTTPPVLDAYRLDGSRLWRINLGANIREGAHYTQVLVYDFDGDGRAEVACKTADGTIDGEGRVLGDPQADHRDLTGRTTGKILRGPEFLTVFDGASGAASATVDFVPPRHPDTTDPSPEQLESVWGDAYGNRIDRFLACVAYLDGERPSLIFSRGYYTRAVITAWDWREGRLTRRWTFDSDAGPADRRAYRGQGNHSIAAADVDGDGRDEVVFGACVIDDDGTGLYSTGLGHGDAQHTTDLDPAVEGVEIFSIHENADHQHGINLRDARTGRLLWSKASSDVVRGLAADLDPRHPGLEMWAAGPGLPSLLNARGDIIAERKPRSCNFAVWWDGDLLRELLDRTRISKWHAETSTESMILDAPDVTSINGSKATPALCADVVGDWREEVIWPTRDGRELRIYCTPHPTPHRIPTLMHDPHYRLGVVCQNVGYNQPPHPGFFLGHGMNRPRPASIRTPVFNR